MTDSVLRDTPEWRFIVTNKNTRTVSLLDGRSSDRDVTVALNTPWQHSGLVASDDPEINIPFPDWDSPANLTNNTRFIYGFRRQAGDDPPWHIRFSGIVMTIEDVGADATTSRYTAYDPWQYMYNRPARNPETTAFLTDEGYEYPGTARASDIVVELLQATVDVDGPVPIDFSDTSLIHDTIPLAIPFTIDPGLSVAEVWNALVETGTIDIYLEPIYEPEDNPGMLCKLHTHVRRGSVRHSAVMGFDRAGNSLTSINRQIDGQRVANQVQYFAGSSNTPVTLQTDTDSIALYGQYWAQQFFPGSDNAALVEAAAFADMLIRRYGQKTLTFDPAPELTLIPLRDYHVGDYVPLWASRNFREPLGVDYDAYIADPDNPGAAGYVRIQTIPINIENDGTERVRALIVSDETPGFGFGVVPPTPPVDPIKLRSQHAAFPANDAAVASFALPASAVYASWDFYIPAESVAGNTQDPNFVAIGTAFQGNFYIDEATDEVSWRIFISSTSGEDDLRALVPTDTWVSCSLVLGAGTSARSIELTVGGLSTGTYAGSGTFHSYDLLTFGWFNNGGNQPPAAVYTWLRNIKIGTTVGGSDILDYQGDLSIFGPDDDYQSGAGNVTVEAM